MDHLKNLTVRTDTGFLLQIMQSTRLPGLFFSFFSFGEYEVNGESDVIMDENECV